MKGYRLDPKKPPQLTAEEARRLEGGRIDYSDIPPLGDEFFAQAKRAWPPAKQQITLRLDTDVGGMAENARQRLPNSDQPHPARGDGKPKPAPINDRARICQDTWRYGADAMPAEAVAARSYDF
jgi:hypothetical protein